MRCNYHSPNGHFYLESNEANCKKSFLSRVPMIWIDILLIVLTILLVVIKVMYFDLMVDSLILHFKFHQIFPIINYMKIKLECTMVLKEVH